MMMLNAIAFITISHHPLPSPLSITLSLAEKAGTFIAYRFTGATAIPGKDRRTMLDRTATKFSHVRPGDTEFKDEGLRDFFVYRDLGVSDATAGKVLVQLTRAQNAPEKGTGWHYHVADFHVVIMLKGWARFM